MSNLNIQTRGYSSYLDISLECDGTTIEMGFHDVDAAAELKNHLLDVLDEISKYLEDQAPK